jgi:hypothetical protein
MYALPMRRACVGIVIALGLGCTEPVPRTAAFPRAPPDPVLLELVRNLTNPPFEPTAEELAAMKADFEARKARDCADPRRGCDLYRALREGKVVLERDPPVARAAEPRGR